MNYFNGNFNGSNPMNTMNTNKQYTDPPIYIFPQLKELSKTLTGVDKKCGMYGLTNENCIADYKNVCPTTQAPINPNCGKLTKRNSYTSYANSDKKYRYPNSYLPIEAFNVEHNPNFEIGRYSQNWSNLYSEINNIIAKQYPAHSEDHNKINVFISGHQHNFQQMFFKFIKTSTSQKYGFRNCTCVKISKDTNGGSMKIISAQDMGRDKNKYNYMTYGENLVELLKDGTYFFGNILSKCDIYMIRHGEAVHNLVDVYKMLQKKYKEPSNIPDHIITKGNKEMLAKVKQYGGYIKLNALLTTQGVEQARALQHCVINGRYGYSIDNNKSIYISSPMNRTIQTLIYSTSKNAVYFPKLRDKFMDMYNTLFPETAIEIENIRIPNEQCRNQNPSEKDDYGIYDLFGSTGGIRRKSRRNMKRKSKRNKRSKKARKTRKHKKVRRTRRK